MLEASRSPSPSGDADDSSAPQYLTHAEEQARLRAETISAFHTDPSLQKPDAEDEDEDEEEGGLFTLREKTKDEVRREEEEYREYLERELREGGVEGLEGLKELVEVEEIEGGVKREPDEEEGERKKKKKGKKERQEEKVKGSKDSRKGKEENDQEFLMKCVRPSCFDCRSAIGALRFQADDSFTAISSIEAGLTVPRNDFLPSMKSPLPSRPNPSPNPNRQLNSRMKMMTRRSRGRAVMTMEERRTELT